MGKMLLYKCSCLVTRSLRVTVRTGHCGRYFDTYAAVRPLVVRQMMAAAF